MLFPYPVHLGDRTVCHKTTALLTHRADLSAAHVEKVSAILLLLENFTKNA